MKRSNSKLIVLSLIVAVGICLLMVEITFARKITPTFSFKVTKEVTPWPPHLGDELEIVYTVESKYDLDSIYISHLPVKGARVISHLEPIGFRVWEKEKYNEYYKKLQGIDRLLWFTIKKGEEKKFRLRVKLDEKIPEKRIKVFPIVDISVGVTSLWTKEHGDGVGVAEIQLFLLDEKTGLLGTGKDKGKGLPVEYRYDAVDGTFYPPGSLDTPVNVEWNRRIIQMMKKLDPALSDSQALLLHSDHYRIGTPKEASHWDEEKKCLVTDEEKIFEYYLKDGWFKALLSGKREEWIKKEKEKIKLQYEEKKKGGSSKAKFFRSRSGSGDFHTLDPDSIAKEFHGWWRYKDHLYNKDQGLLADAVKKPIVNGKARLLLYYEVGVNWYRILTDYYTTNSSGYFSITANIPESANNCKAYPIIYPSGPDPTSPVINLSDPNITQPGYWKDPDDPNLFIMRELGFATPHVFYANSIPVNLDTIWTDTFPAVSQPQSGCINIYETLVHARTFTSPPPTNPLRVLWEPGYIPIRIDTLGIVDTCWTCYVFDKDTMYVSGCTLSTPPLKKDTDEWDDDILYHEFGHYQMDFYNIGLDPWQGANYNPDHRWWLNDVDHQATAWIEGWGNFFSGRARVGSGTDTLFVNTDLGIGKGQGYYWYYFNLEDPWKQKDSLAHPFQGGEFCEGAVTGILFDIYDSYNEYPYPRDSLRSDSLTLGWDPIFHIMAEYNPPQPNATQCWGLNHFYSAWRFWANYGEIPELLQIFNYHGYFPLPTNPPQNPGVQQKPQNWWLIVDWLSPLPPKDLPRAGIAGYCVYRLDPDTTDFKRITEYAIEDTFYLDFDVVVGETYSYYITALDSFGLESNPSDTISWIVTHWLLVSDTDEASAHGKKIERDGSGDIYIVYTAFDSIYHVSTTDKGLSWSGKPIGEGEYPSIDLDSNDKSNVVWMWYAPPMHIAQSILYFARDTGSSWTDPDTLWDYPAGSGIPCFQIDNDDTGHVAWNSYLQFGPGLSVGTELNFGYFPTQAASPTFNDTTVIVDPTDPGIEVPSLAIDSFFYHSHVVFTRDGNIYYTKINKTSWTTPQRISDNSDSSANPYIEFDKGSSKMHVVWQQKKGGKYQIMHSSKGFLSLWPKPTLACLTGYNSVNPVITSGEFIVWSEEITNNSEIYYSRYSGGSWGEPVLVKNTPEASMYPQVTHTSGADSDTVFVAWTDGDSLPFTIEFQQLNFAKTVLFSGHISENTTWSTDILIKGDVWVDAGVTLTIDVGVNVKFIPNFDDEHSGIDPTRAEFIIQGGLELLGNESMPITFTSNAPQPEIDDWYGIRFVEPEKREYQVKEWVSILSQPTESRKKSTTESTKTQEPQSSRIEEHKVSGETIENKLQKPHFLRPVTDKRVDDDFEPIEKESNEKTIEKTKNERQKRVDEKKDTRLRRNIHYLEIEYAKTGLTLCEDKMLSMKNCAFKNNEAGLKLTGKSNVSVTNSVFEDNTIYGIFIGEGVTGYIKDCTVSLNSTGIIFAGNTSSEAKELDIEEDNTGGNVSNISNLSIRHSRIINNYDYGIYITNDAEPDLGGRGHNYIYGSGLFDLYNNTDNKIMAKMNYWGTKETDTVKEHIYDYYDDNSLGIVEVEPLWEGEDEKGKGGEMLSGEGTTPLIYSFKHPSPNPFVNNTTIAYSIAKPGNVSLNIYDISGRLIKTLVDEKKDAGVYSVRWNGSDDDKRQVAIGVYFIRLTSGDFTSVKKVILVR